MLFESLMAVSPIDGRYQKSSSELQHFFSEYALFKYRTFVEIEYFLSLCDIEELGIHLKEEDKSNIRSLVSNFSIEDAQRIKEIESVTNHDVKAVEYFIKEKFSQRGIQVNTEYIHFGLTSQDINNTAMPLMVKDALHQVIVPNFIKIKQKLNQFASEWKEIPMLARTHGQAASPTRLGKELMVFVERLDRQLQMLLEVPIACKFGGATGNFNAHHVAYPSIDWHSFAARFCSETLGLTRYRYTTQIEHYDYLAALFDNLRRLNIILLDFCRDVWQYISMDYFKQKIKEKEVGSSAMPHKVNPIDFENAEGNLQLANTLFDFMSNKLPISRLQRDLTDSTVSRNFGSAFAYQLIALKSIYRGCDKLLVNESAIQIDLNKHIAVIAEAIQTVLRREAFPEPYEKLKELTRTNQSLDEMALRNFILGLDVSDSVKTELLSISPSNYTGQ